MRVDGQQGRLAEDDEQLLGARDGHIETARLVYQALVLVHVLLEEARAGADRREDDDATAYESVRDSASRPPPLTSRCPATPRPCPR